MYVLGTAGHVDHGKSTLITHLTGIDPDRLAEEKKRGLTIDLGFAWTTLPSGREIGIVDVPGHERFVHNMLAGAGQVDAVLFVVDALEGWRQQSEEHLAILDFLDVGGGVVAVTKTDLAADHGRATAAAVPSRLKGTALEDAEVIRVSAVTGDGIPELIAAIDRLLDRVDPPRDDDRSRLCIDRSFSIKGSGTVVTGTLTGGRLREGDEIVVLPSGARGRIRGIQTHRTARHEGVPTSRVALNLAGLERHEIRRGDAVVRPGQWRPTTTIDAEVRGVRSLDHPVTAKGAFLLYVGTAEEPARIRLLDAPSIGANERAFIRLTLGEPVVAGPGDRLVLRDTGRRQTVAGGVVLDAHPAPARLRTGDIDDRVAQLKLRVAAPREVAGDRAVAERGVVPTDQLEEIAGAAAPSARRLPSFFVAPEWLAQTTSRLHAVLNEFHRSAPLERGMPREALRAAMEGMDTKLFAETVGAMIEARDLVADGPLLRLAAHRVTLSPELEQARAALHKELEGAAFSPPGLKELTARYGAPLLKALQESGALVRLADDVVYAAEAVERAKHAIAQAAAAEGPLTASRIREILGTSRKYAIPLLEYLDAAGFTKRAGDVRTVRA